MLVNGISYTLDEGESIGIVGESGSGKSVGVLSLMRLIPTPPGRIEAGEVKYNESKPDGYQRQRDALRPRTRNLHDLPGSDDLAQTQCLTIGTTDDRRTKAPLWG